MKGSSLLPFECACYSDVGNCQEYAYVIDKTLVSGFRSIAIIISSTKELCEYKT